MGLDQEMGGGSFEAHPPLDAEDGVAQVDTAPQAVATPQRVEALEERDGIERVPIQRHGHSLCEGEGERDRREVWNLSAGIGAFRKRVPTGECLPAADGGAPQPFVHGVDARLHGHLNAPVGEEGHFLGAAPSQGPHGREDLQLRCERTEGHIEADLIISRAGGTVGHRVHAEVPRDFGDDPGLAGPLGAHGERIGCARSVLP